MGAPSRRKPDGGRGSRFLRGLLTLTLVVGVLYVAKPVIVPLVLAILLAFVLSPLVTAVQKRGARRIAAVVVVVTLTFTMFGLVGWGVGAQVVGLAEELPTHKTEIQQKVAKLRGWGAGLMARGGEMFRPANEPAAAAVKRAANHAEAVEAPDGALAAPAQTRPAAASEDVVVTRTEGAGAVERLSTLAVAVGEPIATAALVLVLVIFMLIQREDLRNRVIGLLGHGRLTGTTRVLVGSAERLSKFLLMQLLLNSAFGALFGIVLLLLGVPYWFLWGFLTVILRFVPYVGAWVAAAMPVVVSFAISPNWAQPLTVLGVFFVLDAVTSNVVEPLVFGHSTGVTPVALLVAAVFWTWVWGPIGLVLSTPLTVCMVVLGQHVPRLRFLSLLLGDQPALAPSVSYYQRLLAGDPEEAKTVADDYARLAGADRVPDDVLLPALRLARRDRARSGLTASDEAFIFDSTAKVVEHLAGKLGGTVATPAPSAGVGGPLVLGCAAHHRSEELAIAMLAAVTPGEGACLEMISTRMLPADVEARVERDRPALVFVAVLPPGGLAQARHLCRRLRNRHADLKIVVGYFGKARDFDRLLIRLRSAGASYVTTSVTQSRTQILSLLSVDCPAPAIAAPAAAPLIDVAVAPA